MGGIGSGRHWRFGADTTEGYRSIDVRWLKREGLLSSGVSRRITWSRHGEVTGSINVRSESGCVILDYRQRDRGGEWQDESYPVHLETTPCHMGGERHWFLCPARGCGRRVAVLYGGDWGKPRGMHWRTYERLCRKHDALSDRALGGIMDHLNRLSDRF